jgi:hypothetical protein
MEFRTIGRMPMAQEVLAPNQCPLAHPAGEGLGDSLSSNVLAQDGNVLYQGDHGINVSGQVIRGAAL